MNNSQGDYKITQLDKYAYLIYMQTSRLELICLQTLQIRRENEDEEKYKIRRLLDLGFIFPKFSAHLIQIIKNGNKEIEFVKVDYDSSEK